MERQFSIVLLLVFMGTCYCQSEVRLVGGNRPNEGRVEVFIDGEWGTICDDLWTINDGHVVCRQLGYFGAEMITTFAYYGKGSGRIWLDNVECMGNEESLADCPKIIGDHNCQHYEDAGVECKIVEVSVTEDPLEPTPSSNMKYRDDYRCGGSYLAPNGEVAECNPSGVYPCCSPYNWCGITADHCNCEECIDYRTVVTRTIEEIRLVGGSSPNVGRVEVFVDGQWGTVCDDDWDVNDATVVCRQLGYPGADSAEGFAFFGEGSDPIWLDNVGCFGREENLNDCAKNGFGEHNCNHYEDAGVRCTSTVAPTEISEHSNKRFRDDYQCGGDYLASNGEVAECDPDGIYPCCSPYNWCGNSESHCDCDECIDYRIPAITNVRLVDGDAPNAGRIEVLVSGQWGTVCDDDWDLSDATVVCRILGFTGAQDYYFSAHFGEGSGPIWIDNLGCSGAESSLNNCSKSNLGDHNCGHHEDASVRCTVEEVTADQSAFRDDYRCGGFYLAPNEEVAQCDPNGIYPCCSPYNWCGITADHCGCEGCVDYRVIGKSYREDNRCGGDYIAPNGEVAQCDPNGIYPCCSPYNWCGNTTNHCDCDGCTDYRLPAPPVIEDIRLVDGTTENVGRVEVFINGEWGTICDDLWDQNDAVVVCRQLGYAGASYYRTSAFYGRGEGPIWLDNVECTGSEDSLEECQKNEIGEENCAHSEDVSVGCIPLDGVTSLPGEPSIKEIRLVGGEHKNQGRVEVLVEGQWGTVCDDEWDLEDADVVCRQLGYSGALASLRGATFGEGTGAIWLDNVECTGTETSLNECDMNDIGDENCGHYEDAGVTCASDVTLAPPPDTSTQRWRDDYRCGGDFLAPNGEVAECNPNGPNPCCSPFNWCDVTPSHCECEDCIDYRVTTGSPIIQDIRLADGRTVNMGRVEVLVNGVWGTVCDDLWDMNDATVTCKQLGFPGAEAARQDSYFGTGSDIIWLDNVECVGDETTLDECPKNDIGDEDCGGSEHAGVVCLPWDTPPASATNNWRTDYRCGGEFYAPNGEVAECDPNGTNPCCSPYNWCDVTPSHCDCEGCIDYRVLASPIIQDIRLADGRTVNMGRVEVLVNGVWGTVCDDLWDIDDATVTCKQLGFPGAEDARQNSYFGTGSDTIWLDNVECVGDETTLDECPKNDIGDEDCGGSEHAGVVCLPWNTPPASATNRWRADYRCGGEFYAPNGEVAECDPNGTNPCCSPYNWCDVTPSHCDCGGCIDYRVTASPIIQDIRLAEGRTVNMGRVEVLVNGVWGTVCDDLWDIDDASVTCKQLGFPGAEDARQNSYFGTGSDTIWLDNVECVGDETTLDECPKNDIGDEDCGGSEHAGVVCLPWNTPPASATNRWRADYRCGGEFYAPNGEVAECDPNGTNPCCSPYNWCDVTPSHCDCGGCIDYRVTDVSSPKAWRDDYQCGGSYLAPNGEVAQCDPEGIYPCCSPYNWCGITADHCDCEECIDYRETHVSSPKAWRDDYQCGGSYLAPNGEVAQCDPEGIYPCCSPYNWCGITADHCDCEECTDYRETHVSPLKAWRDDYQCGGSYLAPNGEVAQCDPEGIYPCCSPYNWCGITADHCDCEECIDYRETHVSSPKAWRDDYQCGGSYLAPNGEVAQCDPEGISPCCSPYNWCGITADYCDCEECTDYRETHVSPLKAWRDDYQCGGSYLAPNGQVAQCDPEGIYPCCSPYNWCGITEDHCDCEECIDYRETQNSTQRWRDDFQCGSYFMAPNGEAAECDPYSPNPCCSPQHWCDVTPSHCECVGCIDYRKVYNVQTKFREDRRCRGIFLAPNGHVAECDPDGMYPCCSPSNWCGITADHCDCAECIDYRSPVVDTSTQRWRDDLRCRSDFLAPNGEVAECNPNSPNPCCSPYNWCDVTPSHCECEGCIDYRITRYENIRLTGGQSESEGLVEVLVNGDWGTVCDDLWDLNDAIVACKELGYPGAESFFTHSHFGLGTGEIWLDDVECSGNEVSLNDCVKNRIGQHNCGHDEDAGVRCTARAPATEATPVIEDIRLVNGYSHFSGRVEVYVNGEWGTVCHDRWEREDADVACRWLGYTGADVAKGNAFFGEGTGPIWLDNVRCRGDEETLNECRMRPIGEHNCEHDEDAGVECTIVPTPFGPKPGNDYRDDLRCRGGYHAPNFGQARCNRNGEYPCCSPDLWCGNTPEYCECEGCVDYRDASVKDIRLSPFSHAGKVEVFVFGEWGSVCNDYWDIADANVACRMLGFPGADEIKRGDYYGEGYDPVVMDDVHCTGDEETLSDCPRNEPGFHDCDHRYEAASVVCTLPPSTTLQPPTTQDPNQNYRDDYRCGGDFLAPNGEVAKCKKDGQYPCCSPAKWCGMTSDHCDCAGCTDYRYHD